MTQQHSTEEAELLAIDFPHEPACEIVHFNEAADGEQLVFCRNPAAWLATPHMPCVEDRMPSLYVCDICYSEMQERFSDSSRGMLCTHCCLPFRSLDTYWPMVTPL